MCPHPIPDISLKNYLLIGLATIFLSLCLYCKVLNDENDKLEIANSNLKIAYNQKVQALSACSKGVEDLVKREDEITKNAKEAVEKAKKEAVAEYKASNDILFRKPVQPKVTPDNAKNYGGNDTMIQLKDYLATQMLMNELIDQRGDK